MDFIAVKPGKAKIRCYVQGKSKKKYGDTITVTVTKKRVIIHWQRLENQSNM